MADKRLDQIVTPDTMLSFELLIMAAMSNLSSNIAANGGDGVTVVSTATICAADVIQCGINWAALTEHEATALINTLSNSFAETMRRGRDERIGKERAKVN